MHLPYKNTGREGMGKWANYGSSSTPPVITIPGSPYYCVC
ncbi:hypothetical protein CGMCC3_g4039 [Colletotrichum fructicola]|nr:uncharacterized protein CGMCC3_g4039 [Colletotrichum fructicola]KAE9580036.1 hypothetical protein CGMCC3_g4039 [Colletotrichum fructicola]